MRAPVLLALAFGGCAQTVAFEHCNTDSDCPADGGPAYCTADHLCVDSLPDDKLCPPALLYPPNLSNATRVGAIFRLNDPSVPSDDQVKDQQRISAIQLAVDQINGRVATTQPYQVVFCDSGGGGNNDDLRPYQRLMQQYGVAGIVGEPTSGGVTDVQASLVTDHALLITPAATVIGLADGMNVFRTCPADDLQVQAFVQLVARQFTSTPPPTIASIHSGGSQAKGLWSKFKTMSGRIPTPDLALDDIMASDPYAAAGQMLLATNPDIIVIFADSDIPPLLEAIAKAPAPAGWPRMNGPNSTKIILPFAGKTKHLVANTVDERAILPLIEGLEPAYTSSSVPYQDLFTQMQSHGFVAGSYNTTFVPETFDAMFLLLASVEASGRTGRGEDLAASLQLLTTSGGMPIGAEPDQFTQLASAMRNKMSVQLTGASGPIRFTPQGDLASRTLGIWQIDIAATLSGNASGTAFVSMPLP